MSKFLVVILSILLFSGCATIKGKKEIEKSFLNPLWREEIVKNVSDLSEKEKKAILDGKILVEMEKGKVEKVLGLPYGKYVPDSKMMEVWFYDDFFVGFDKNGKVVKFGIFQQEEENQKKE